MIAYGHGTTLCHLQDHRIDEASGLVASSLQDGVLFTHNDSGDTARFFAIGLDCRTRATYTLPRVKARDWEDIARGPGAVLWLGDIGDNNAVRKRIFINRVIEPVVPVTSTTPIALPSTQYPLVYPDGPHNAETLLSDPVDGRLYVLTKSFVGPDTLYAAPLPLRPGVDNHLVKLEQVTFPLTSLATAGDISPDGKRLVIRTYLAAYETDIVPAAHGPRLATVFAKGPGRTIDIPSEDQGEAIAYSRDGRSLYTTSEGVGAPLDLIPAAAAPAPRPSAVVTAVPVVKEHRRPWWPFAAAGIAVILSAGWVVQSRRR